MSKIRRSEVAGELEKTILMSKEEAVMRNLALTRGMLDYEVSLSKRNTGLLVGMGVGALLYGLFATDNETTKVISYVLSGGCEIGAAINYVRAYLPAKRDRDYIVTKIKEYLSASEKVKHLLKEKERLHGEMDSTIINLQKKVVEYKKEALAKGDSSTIRMLNRLDRTASHLMKAINEE